MRKFQQTSDGTVYDIETGEILGGIENKGTWYHVPYRPKLKESYFMFFQSACKKLAKDDLTGEELKVLLSLIGELDFENYILIQQVDIAEELKLKPSHVSRAIKKLVEKGILIKGQKIGRTSSYKLNSAYGWKGRVINFYNENEIPKTRLIVDNTKTPENHPS